MNCTVCGRTTENAQVGLGAYCSEAHRTTLEEAQERDYKTLLDEPIGVIPEEFDVASFERLALKLALCFYEAIPEEERPAHQRGGRWLWSPSEFALHIKERVLEHIPAGYVSTLPVSGAAALFVDSSYAFRTKVPKAIVLRALVSAGILNEEHLEDLES